eukprot:3593156-Amphidinium_carterae.2
MDKTRLKLIAANKGNQDETMKAIRSIENAAKHDKPCPECLSKFSKMNIKLALALQKLASREYESYNETKRKQLTVKMRKQEKATSGLAKVKCSGDCDLQGFIDRWDEVINRLSKPMAHARRSAGDYVLGECQAVPRVGLRRHYVWNQYRFADANSPIRSYRWLRENIN